MASLSLQGIRKSFGKTEVIKGINLEIRHGEFVVFVGPSGCGKSTLLRMIAGLEDITDGTLRINDNIVNHVQPKERGVAMVFQSYAIFPHMTVRENMGFGLTISKAPKKEKEAKVLEAARILQMEYLLDRKPSQLSGGQRQRVAIGRAIVRNPSVFLFDEPLSNLDASLRFDMRLEIGKLHQQLGNTMLYVTHDQAEAMTLADKIVVMNNGVAEQVGTPMALFKQPANLFVATFIGSPAMNILDVVVKAKNSSDITVASTNLRPLKLPQKQVKANRGDGLKLGIRPQHLKRVQTSDDALLSGSVSLAERLGTETVVDIELPAQQKIIAAFAEDIELNRGDAVHLSFDADHVCLFNE